MKRVELNHTRQPHDARARQDPSLEKRPPDDRVQALILGGLGFFALLGVTYLIHSNLEGREIKDDTALGATMAFWKLIKELTRFIPATLH